MKDFCRSVLFLVILVWNSPLALAQSEEITIRFIGNCGLHISDGTYDLYTDFPYKSGAHHYMEFDEVELENIKEDGVFIFTHKHSDHYSKKNLKKVLKAKKGQTYGPWNIEDLKKLSETIPDFSIEAFRTKHRFTFKHYSYLITWHGKKIYLSGDTESVDTLAKVKDIDWAFVPYWILLDATEKDIRIDAKKIGMYHLYPNQKFTIDTPDKLKAIMEQGMLIHIPY